MIVPKRIRVDKAGVVSWRNEEGGRASTVTTIHAPAGEFVDARIADEMLAALKALAETTAPDFTAMTGEQLRQTNEAWLLAERAIAAAEYDE